MSVRWHLPARVGQFVAAVHIGCVGSRYSSGAATPASSCSAVVLCLNTCVRVLHVRHFALCSSREYSWQSADCRRSQAELTAKVLDNIACGGIGTPDLCHAAHMHMHVHVHVTCACTRVGCNGCETYVTDLIINFIHVSQMVGCNRLDRLNRDSDVINPLSLSLTNERGVRT